MTIWRRLPCAVFLYAAVATAQVWQPLNNPVSFDAGSMLLLTDGTVMVHLEQSNSSQWYKLTPDANGSYVNGTWTQIASMPAGYAPLYFASAVLPDGRVIVEGGEYNNLSAVWSNKGAIYDPLTNRWTSVAPASGTNSEIYDPALGTWTSAGSTIVQLWDSADACGGIHKASFEVGPAVLRPDGTVFYTGSNTCAAGHTAIYNSRSGTWRAGPDFPSTFNI